jgi:hypothetical protein
MNRDKAVNLAWVVILVPMVLSIFKLIHYAGFREEAHWLLMMGLILAGMVILLFIPRTTGWLYDRYVIKQQA